MDTQQYTKERKIKFMTYNKPPDVTLKRNKHTLSILALSDIHTCKRIPLKFTVSLFNAVKNNNAIKNLPLIQQGAAPKLSSKFG